MKRTQVYLTSEQHEFLENLAFYLSKQTHKKTTISELVRQAIDKMQENYKNIKDETNFILNSELLLDGLEKGRNEKGLLNHSDVFGDL